MSAFDDFCASAKRAAHEVGKKVEYAADAAAANLKIKNLEYRMEEEYEKLGRLTFRELQGETVSDDEKMEVVASLNALADKLYVLKEERAARKAKKGDGKTDEATAEEPAEGAAAEAEEAPAEEPAEKPESEA